MYLPTRKNAYCKIIIPISLLVVLIIFSLFALSVKLNVPDEHSINKIIRTDLKTCKNCFPVINIDQSYPKYPCSMGILGQRSATVRNQTGLVIMVDSEAHLKHQRDMTREIWERRKLYNVEVKFVLGQRRLKKSEREALIIEMNQHKDIIIGHFDDTYKNLTMKSIFAIRWAVANCQYAKYVMKTDHDVAINIDNLMKMLIENSPSGVVGDCFGPIAPIRDPLNKWYTPMKEYPFSYFPKYCSGIGYVVPMYAAKALVKLSPSVRLLTMEDVYISLLLTKLGVLRQHVRGFSRVRSWAPSSGEYFCNCVIAVHDYTQDERYLNGQAVLNQDCVIRSSFYCFFLVLKARYISVSLFIVIVCIAVKILLSLLRFSLYRIKTRFRLKV